MRSLKVTTRKCHASLGATQYSAEIAKHTYGGRTLNWTVACRQAGRERGRSEEGWGWREGARGGWEEAIMSGMDGAGVEEGRVEEGNEQERDVKRH